MKNRHRSLGQERNVTRVFKDDVSGGIDERDFLGKDVDMVHRPEIRPSPHFRVGVDIQIVRERNRPFPNWF